MANSKLAAVDKLKPFLPLLQALVGGIDELSRVGSLEQAGDEAQARVDLLAKQESEAKARISQLAADHAKAEKDVADKKVQRDRAERQYDADLAAIRALQAATLADEAAVERGKAQAQASLIIAEAQDHAGKIVADATDKAMRHQQVADAAWQKLEAIKQETAQVQARHDELMRAHAALRAKLL